MAGRQVLDIGCGEGRFSRLLAGLGADATRSIDLTEDLVAQARALASGGETYLVGNAEDLTDLDDESFDLGGLLHRAGGPA